MTVNRLLPPGALFVNDNHWKASVRVYAAEGLGKDPRDPAFQELSGYMWKDTDTYKRLAETPEGRFWREIDNVCPDHGLRAMYRKELVKS